MRWGQTFNLSGFLSPPMGVTDSEEETPVIQPRASPPPSWDFILLLAREGAGLETNNFEGRAFTVPGDP